MASVYTIHISKAAAKDFSKLSFAQQQKAMDLIEHVLSVSPTEGKKLVGPLLGKYSIRLNIKDRIVYTIHKENSIVRILRMRSHYERS